MAQSQEKGKGLDLNVLVLAAAGVVVMVFVFWFAAHNLISFLVVRGRQVELYCIGYALKLFVGDNAPLAFAKAYASSATRDLTFSSTLNVMRESGVYVRWIFSPVLIGLGIYLFRLAPNEKFKFKHTVDSLAKQESELWPEIKPALGRKLGHGDITKGPWAVSATEWEYVRRYELAEPGGEVRQQIFTVPGAPRESTEIRERLNREKTTELMIKQLGPIWRGFDALPPYAKGIYAALIIRVAAVKIIDTKKKKAQLQRSDAFFRKMAIDYAKADGDVSKMDFGFAQEVYKELGSHELVKLTHVRHSYVFTAFAQLLQLSRTDGVVASSLFIWLRPVNRRLWFILNCVGGYAFFVEGAGIAAHWLAEKEIGIGLLAPAIGESVVGLASALEQYVEEDEYEEMFKK